MQLPFETAFVDTGHARLECLVSGRGNGKVAILLHGFPEAHFSWRHQIGFLTGLGYEVWAPNQRGYGGSSRPRPVAAYHVDHLVEDVAGLIDQVAAERPVTLIAHDWGAIVAWIFAIDRKRALERLVICNVPHPARFAEELRRPGSDQLRRSWYVFFFQLPWLPEALMRLGRASAIGRAFTGMAKDQTHFGADVIEAYRANALLPGALTAMVNWYRANARSAALARYRRGAARVIDVPTLMIWGEEDSALSVTLTEGYEGLVRDFTLVRLPGVSHWVQQEAPEPVNRALGTWLQGGDPARA
jgi:pimeloyl-ACP methyl ester carboxylesterase